MDKNYITYTADQLLNDDFFIQSELHPTEESRAFWSDLQTKNAALSGEIENARLFLHTIKIDRDEGVSKPTHPLFISFPPFPDIVFFYAAIFRVV